MLSQKNKTIPLRGELFSAIYLEWHRWFLFSSFEKEIKILYVDSLSVEIRSIFTPHVETGILFLHANKGRKRETVFDAFEISCALHVEKLGFPASLSVCLGIWLKDSL